MSGETAPAPFHSMTVSETQRMSSYQVLLHVCLLVARALPHVM